MDRKILLPALALITVLVGLGIFVILEDDGGGEPVLDDTGTALQAPGKSEEQETLETEERPGEREALTLDENRFLDEEEVMPLSFRQALGGFKGRVVEKDETPVPDLSVEMYGASFLDAFTDPAKLMGEEDFDFAPKHAQTRTAEDGTFFLSGAFPLAFYVLSLDGGGMRCQARYIDHLPGPGEIVDLGDIVLPPHGVILGRVVDEEGAPRSGARVRATNLPPIVYLSGAQDYRKGGSLLINPPNGFFKPTVIQFPPLVDELFDKLPIPVTRTDRDGLFRLEGVPVGLVTVLIDHKNYLTSTHGPVSVKEGGEKDLGDVTIRSGAVVRGVVVDEKDTPVPGAEVRVGSIYSFKEFSVLKPPIRAGAEGTFAQPGINDLSAMAAARRDPMDHWTVVGPVNPSAGQVKLVLPPAYDLKVFVKDEQGAAVKDAVLKIKAKSLPEDMIYINPPRLPGKKMERPEPGVITLKGLNPGEYELWLAAPGYAVMARSIELKDSAREVAVKLKPALSVPVQVFDKATGEPVEWAEVYTWLDDDDFLFHPTRVSRCRTDKQGRAVLKGLTMDEYHVTASHPRYAVHSIKFKAPVKEELVFELEGGGAVEGVVYPGSSRRVPPYMLFMELRAWGGTPERETPRFLATDLEGRFKTTNLTPGTWRIDVLPRLFHLDPLGLLEAADMRSFHHYRCEITAGETTYVEMTIGSEDTGPSSTVSGRIHLDGVPVEGAKVRVWDGMSHETSTDANGRYMVDHVAVGTHGMQVEIPFNLMRAKRCDLKRRITVEKNIPLYEDFEIMTGSILGKVVNKVDGTPAKGSWDIYAYTAMEKGHYVVNMGVTSEPDGTFHFTRVPVGIYEVGCHSPEARCEPVTRIKVFPGQASDPIVLQRETPITVSGRVVFSDTMKSGNWMMLFFEPVDNNRAGYHTVEINKETGEFSTQALLAASYRIHFYTGGVAYEPIPMEIPPTGMTNLELVFEEHQE